MGETGKSPAFQWYPADYLGSQRVALLTLEQEGAYVRLLSYCWQHGSIPADPELIARLVGKGASTTLANTVAKMFEPHPSDRSKLVHDRLDAERRKQAEWRQKSARGGKATQERRRKGAQLSYHQQTTERCLPDGSNQTSTLQSSVFSLQDNRAPAVARARDPLFDSLASACGSNPGQMTDRAKRSCGVALAEIRKAHPGVEPDEFARRAARYRRLYRDAACTPSALCSHWAECGEAVTAAAAAPSVYTEPSWDWKAAGTAHGLDLAGKAWSDLSTSARADILRWKP